MTNTTTNTQSTDARAIAAAERAKRAAKAGTPAPAATERPIPAVVKSAERPTRTHNKNGRRLARGLPCLCGCGAPTHTPDARFLSGHDARLRKAMKAGGWAAVPEITRPFYADGETIAGFAVGETESGEFELLDRHAGGVWA